MQGNRLVLIAACIPALAAFNGTAVARGSFAQEHPFAAEHINQLPADIRRGLTSRARACGSKVAAAHYFSTTIEADGLRFRSLHFEEFACEAPGAICQPGGCLHEIYLESGGRSRLVFSTYARELRMTNHGGIAGLEVLGNSVRRMLRWNGRSFVPLRSYGKGY